MSAVSIVPLKELDMGYARRPWAFADVRREEIDAHFAKLRIKNPALWNGQVLMLGDFSIVDAVLLGTYFPVDYASFLAWRDFGYADVDVRDCFAMGAIRAADGGFLLGTMAQHTANPGLIYFPCGTPDHNDVVAGKVDMEGNIRRELEEETGLRVAEFVAEPGWVSVWVGPWIANMKLLQASQRADALRERILDFLAQQTRPELADIRVVRGPNDLDSMMPPHVVAYLQYMWRQNGSV